MLIYQGVTMLKNISQWEGLSHILWKKTCLINWLVVFRHPSEKYESVGMMTFPTEWKKSCSKPPSSISWVFSKHIHYIY